MKARLAFLLMSASGVLAACQQPSVPTASTPSPGIDSLSRNVTQSQGGSVRGTMSLNPPPIRPAPPEIATEGR
jgi:hypothetical protein